MNDEPKAPPRPVFLVTKEYRRFAEFADACRRDQYIGVCYGPPGVGKTLSARHYARWDDVEDGLTEQRTTLGADIPPDLADCRTLVYTPTVATTPRRLGEDLTWLSATFNELVRSARQAADLAPPPRRSVVELLIVDEADRLKMPELEELRDRYDRANFRDGVGVVLIGLPGIEKRLARYPQLYSRVGFVHHFRPLGEEELRFILAHKWREVGLRFSPDDWTDAEALAAIARITGGNFRLVQRLFAQIERVLEINRLRTITKEVVETARETLVIGPLA
jgi:DNA transposition AAA+ family ATPase